MDDLFRVLSELPGFLFIGPGWRIWRKRRMDLIIRCRCDKVRKEDKGAYRALSGIGLPVTGIGFCLSGAGAPFIPSARVLLPITAGIAAGTALLLPAGIRYSR